MKRKHWIVGAIVVLFIVLVGAGWAYHEQPTFCATCHVMQSHLDSWESGSLLAFEHRRANVDCLDCHPFDPVQSAQELISFVSGKYEDPLPERQYPKEWCFRCHPAHSSYEQLIALTADYKTDNCDAVNPHAHKIDTDSRIIGNPHGTDDPKYEVPCYHCHKLHRESPGLTYCTGCHHPETKTFASCDTPNCHGGNTSY